MNPWENDPEAVTATQPWEADPEAVAGPWENDPPTDAAELETFRRDNRLADASTIAIQDPRALTPGLQLAQEPLPALQPPDIQTPPANINAADAAGMVADLYRLERDAQQAEGAGIQPANEAANMQRRNLQMAGLAPEDINRRLEDFKALDFSASTRGMPRARTLSDGRLVVDPALAFDPAAWNAAVDGSSASDVEKENAKYYRTQLREELAQQIVSPLRSASPEFAAALEKGRATRSVGELVEDFKRTNSGTFSNLWDQFGIALSQGKAQLGKSLMGAARMATFDMLPGNLGEGFADDAQWHAQRRAALGGGQWAGDLTATVVGTLPAVAVGAGTSSFPAMLATAGGQTAGDTFVSARQAGWSPLEAAGAALVQGGVEVGVTAAFGRTGIESVAAGASEKGLVRRVITEGAAEIPEEVSITALQSPMNEVIQPGSSADLPQQLLDTAWQSFAIGGGVAALNGKPAEKPAKPAEKPAKPAAQADTTAPAPAQDTPNFDDLAADLKAIANEGSDDTTGSAPLPKEPTIWKPAPEATPLPPAPVTPDENFARATSFPRGLLPFVTPEEAGAVMAEKEGQMQLVAVQALMNRARTRQAEAATTAQPPATPDAPLPPAPAEQAPIGPDVQAQIAADPEVQTDVTTESASPQTTLSEEQRKRIAEYDARIQQIPTEMHLMTVDQYVERERLKGGDPKNVTLNKLIGSIRDAASTGMALNASAVDELKIGIPGWYFKVGEYYLPGNAMTQSEIPAQAVDEIGFDIKPFGYEKRGGFYVKTDASGPAPQTATPFAERQQDPVAEGALHVRETELLRRLESKRRETRENAEAELMARKGLPWTNKPEQAEITARETAALRARVQEREARWNNEAERLAEDAGIEITADNIPFSQQKINPEPIAQAVRETMEMLGVGPDVVTAEVVDDVESIEDIKARRAAMASKKAGNNIRAFYLAGKAGKPSRVIINAAGVRTPEQARIAVLHEVAGHHGLRVLFTRAKGKWRGIVDRLYRRLSNGELSQDVQRETGVRTLRELQELYHRPDAGMNYDPATEEGRSNLIEEVLATMAPFAKKPAWYQSILSELKTLLNRVTGGLLGRSFTDADVNVLLAKARRAAKRGDGKAKWVKMSQAPGKLIKPNEQILETARKDTDALPYKLRKLLDEDARGVVVGAASNVDRLAANEPQLFAQLRDAYAATRAKIRQQFGNEITLYRAQGTGDEAALGSWVKTPKAALNFASKETAEKYMDKSRRLITRTISADDVIAVFSPSEVDGVKVKGQYEEFIVDVRNDIRFSQAPGAKASDAEYLDAVKRGDMATAQRMVDDAAKAAGYGVKAYHGTDANHFTVFDTEKSATDGKTRDPNSFIGSHFAAAKAVANRFSDGIYGAENGRVLEVYLSLKNPLQIGNGKPSDELLAALSAEYEAALKAYDEHAKQKAAKGLPDDALEILESGDAERISELFADPKGEELYAATTKAISRKREAIEGNRPVSEQELLEFAGYNWNKVADEMNVRRGQSGRNYAANVGRNVRSALLQSGYDGVFYWNGVEEERGFGGDGRSYIALHPAQIKSAEPVTYDEGGNIIPLSQRFNEASNDIRFSQAPGAKASDAEYLDAVKRGDMETAQRMWDSVRIKPRDVFYSGDIEIIRNPTGSDYRAIAKEHKEKYPFDRLGETTRFTTDKYGNRYIWRADNGMHAQIEPIIEARERVIVGQNEFNWNSHNGDPVAYDKSGNVIPLSQRFNEASNDIRFSQESAEREARSVQRALEASAEDLKEYATQKKAKADPNVPDAVKQMLNGVYATYSDAQALRDAQAWLDKDGADEVERTLMGGQRAQLDGRDVAAAKLIASRLSTLGLHQRYTDFMRAVFTKMNTQAQGLQKMHLLFDTTTPEGALAYFQKEVENAISQLSDKNKEQARIIQGLLGMLEQFKADAATSRIVQALRTIATSAELTEARKAEVSEKMRAALVNDDGTDTTRVRLRGLFIAAGVDVKAADKMAVQLLTKFRAAQKKARAQVIKKLLKVPKIVKRIPKGMFAKWEKLNDEGALSDAKLFGAIANKFGFPVFTSDDAATIRGFFDRYNAATEPELKLLEADELLTWIHTRTEPAGLLEKYGTLFTLAKLVSFKVFERNLIGNVVMALTRSAGIDVPMWVGRKALSAFTGGRVAPLQTAIGNMFRGQAEVNRIYRVGRDFSIAQGGGRIESMRYGLRTLLAASRAHLSGVRDAQGLRTAHRTVFTSAAGRMFERGMHALLTLPDLGRFYGEVNARLAYLMKMAGPGVVVPTAEMFEDAYGHAMREIYQDKNALTEAANGLVNVLNLKKKFGLGTVIMTFRTVPVNMLKEGLTFSALGVIRAFYNWKVQDNPQRAFESLLKVAAGTGAIAPMGAWLYHLGIITAAWDEDDKVREVQRSMGFQAYAINWSMFKRRWTTGNWHTKEKMLPTDMLHSYGWAQPVAFMLAAGAERQRREELGISVPKYWWERYGTQPIASGIAGFLEQPLVTGLVAFAQDLSRATREENYEYLARVPLRALDIMPSALRDVRYSMNNTVPETRDSDVIRGELSRIFGGIPLVDMPKRYNVMGQAEERYQGVTNSILNVFFNPVTTTLIKDDPVGAEVLRLAAATGDASVAPGRVDKKIQINTTGISGESKTLELTNKDISELQRIQSQIWYKLVEIQTHNPMYHALPPVEQARSMKNAISASQNAAKAYLFGHQLQTMGRSGLNVDRDAYWAISVGRAAGIIP